MTREWGPSVHDRARPLLLLALALLLMGTTQERPVPPVTTQPAGAAAPAYRVVDVPAADTVEIMLDGRRAKLRLIGVVVPGEKTLGARATAFLSQLLEGESVTFRTETGWSADRDGRKWAYVGRTPDGLCANAELIRQGYADVATDRTYAERETYVQYQQRAAQARKGIWASDVKHPTSAPAASQPAGPPAARKPPATTVYITPHGKKYHTEGCRYVSTGATAVSLEEAKKRGLTPCLRCKPPP